MFLEIVKEPWCRFGCAGWSHLRLSRRTGPSHFAANDHTTFNRYDQLLKQVRGETPIDCRHLHRHIHVQDVDPDVPKGVANGTGWGVDATED